MTQTNNNGSAPTNGKGAQGGNEQLGDLFNAGLLNEPIAAIEVLENNL